MFHQAVKNSKDGCIRIVLPSCIFWLERHNQSLGLYGGRSILWQELTSELKNPNIRIVWVQCATSNHEV